MALIRRWLSKFGILSKEERYLELIKQFEDSLLRPEEVPQMLAELWRRIDINLFSVLTTRDLMSVRMFIRHDNIRMLLLTLSDITSMASNESMSLTENVARTEFMKFRKINVDEYFSDANGYSVNIFDSVKNLKEQIIYHSDVMELLNTSYYSRSFSRIYHDIIIVTKTLLKCIEEKSMEAK